MELQLEEPEKMPMDGDLFEEKHLNTFELMDTL